MSEKIYSALNSIGVNVSTKEKIDPFTDIEQTLIQAAISISTDLRLLSLCLSWIKVHGEKVNTERLKKLSHTDNPKWLSLFASFGLHCKQTRWKVLIKKQTTPLANGDVGTAKMRIALKGKEDWSIGTGFLIPKGSEPIENKYVLAPDQLARVNHH